MICPLAFLMRCSLRRKYQNRDRARTGSVAKSCILKTVGLGSLSEGDMRPSTWYSCNEGILGRLEDGGVQRAPCRGAVGKLYGWGLMCVKGARMQFVKFYYLVCEFYLLLFVNFGYRKEIFILFSE
jgi:hypothetical protein